MAAALPQLVVVSLHKAGTHLILRLIEEIGYQRRYFDDALIKSAQRDPADVFLARLEPDTAYFLHECRIDRFPRQFFDHCRESLCEERRDENSSPGLEHF